MSTLMLLPEASAPVTFTHVTVYGVFQLIRCDVYYTVIHIQLHLFALVFLLFIA